MNKFNLVLTCKFSASRGNWKVNHKLFELTGQYFIIRHKLFTDEVIFSYPDLMSNTNKTKRYPILSNNTLLGCLHKFICGEVLD